MTQVYIPVGMIGDGTTTRSRARSRWLRLRPWVGIFSVFLITGIVLLLPQPKISGIRYSTDNPDRGGARAVAQILQRQGVDITAVDDLDSAIAAAGPNDTLAIFGDGPLSLYDIGKLKSTGADIVAIEFGQQHSALVPGVTFNATSSTLRSRHAMCSDSDAIAAEKITSRTTLLVDSSAISVTDTCFATTSEAADDEEYGSTTGSMVVAEDAGRTITLIGDGALFTNEQLTKDGNAALALRVLGHNEHLVWYIPTYDFNSDETPSVGVWDSMPTAARILLVQIAVVAGIATLWKGRRLGPVVAERLPVVVPAAEVSRGRARLYRKMRAYGRAGAALRAGSALRLGTRLGLPRSAPPSQLIDAVARSSGRPAHEIEQLIFGPSPQNDQGLVWLAQELDHLESEVRHP